MLPPHQSEVTAMARNLSFVCALTLSVAWLVASTTTAQAQVGEVAILTGVLSNGATIPLPSYADGSQALESECHWMVSVSAFAGMEGGAPPAEMHCFTEGRVVRVYWCAQSNGTPGI